MVINHSDSTALAFPIRRPPDLPQGVGSLDHIASCWVLGQVLLKLAIALIVQKLFKVFRKNGGFDEYHPEILYVTGVQLEINRLIKFAQRLQLLSVFSESTQHPGHSCSNPTHKKTGHWDRFFLVSTSPVKTIVTLDLIEWSGWRESNPRDQLGKLE